ncbi:MAG: hypothetical protein LBB91_03845 [Clostridiales bacterium]|nr:hypothetical protein [Clostridiales bacterium]
MEKEQIKILWDNMKLQLNEMQRRQYAATLAKAYGYGGATVVNELTGVSLNTITAGKKELENISSLEPGRIRREGGGPKWSEEKYPDIKNHCKRCLAFWTDAMRIPGRMSCELLAGCHANACKSCDVFIQL